MVHIARKLEIGKIRQSMMLRCVNLALFFVSSKVMAFVCIILFLLDGGELNAEIVFVSMSMFSQIRENLTYHFPFGTAIGIEVPFPFLYFYFVYHNFFFFLDLHLYQTN